MSGLRRKQFAQFVYVRFVSSCCVLKSGIGKVAREQVCSQGGCSSLPSSTPPPLTVSARGWLAPSLPSLPSQCNKWDSQTGEPFRGRREKQLSCASCDNWTKLMWEVTSDKHWLVLLLEEIIIKVENDIDVPALVTVAANVSDHERKQQSKNIYGLVVVKPSFQNNLLNLCWPRHTLDDASLYWLQQITVALAFVCSRKSYSKALTT